MLLKNLLRSLMVFSLMGVALVACDRGTTPEDPDPAAQDATADPTLPDDPVEPDEPDMPATTRTGAWLDRLTVIEEPNADSAVARIGAGDIDVYAYTIASPSTFESIQETEGLQYATSYGSYNEMTFNPAACADTTKINPFSVPRIREAMNWLVDRDYLIEEIMGGLGTPRWVPINTASADRGRLAAEIRAIEAEYAYDLERAREVVSEEMLALGASLENEVWTFQGAPVEIIGLIRSEDERTQIGDYFAQQLEDIGFTVVPDYKTSTEAAPIWQGAEPSECLFGYYTGGWIATLIDRDASGNFNFFYTPAGLPRPLWQAYTPTEEFAALAQRLNDSDYGSMDERTELFAQALPLALQDSARIWLLDRTSVAPYREGVSVSSDLSGSIYGSALWPYTLRIDGEEGGELTWASASILTEVWNPIAGTNWIYDNALIRATGQWSFMPDPNTGLVWPQRVESFQVDVQEDLPVSKSLDWVTLNKVPEIVVPDDVWVDWNAETQTFITAADFYTETATALIKTTATYPADLFETITWHDGSAFSLGDMVMSLIMQFDQAKEASAIYDEAQVPSLESFMSTFKGIKIASTDPVTIEFYSDNWSLDAENAISNLRSLWPYYSQGEGAWHTVGLGVMGEAAGEAAFSADKATTLSVEQFSYIAGPTIEILSAQLTEAAGQGTIPYAATMSEFVTPEEAAARYTNLQSWFDERGHYWVGTGPFYLERAFPVESTVSLVRNENFPDPSDKWARFAEAKIAVVQIDSPGMVTAGDTATFDIYVDFDDEPYAASDVQVVKYLAFDSAGELVDTGAAQNVADGHWQVELGSGVTQGLAEGSNRLEVVVVSNLVALPSLGSVDFVSSP